MIMTFNRTVFIVTLFLVLFCTSFETESAQVITNIPVKDTVTMVDFGGKNCIPCKMMEPILKEVKEEFKGRAEVIFIDAWKKDNKEKARTYKVLGIPTQIFFDKQGKEVYRHMGFLDKKSIVEKLESLLAE